MKQWSNLPVNPTQSFLFRKQQGMRKWVDWGTAGATGPVYHYRFNGARHDEVRRDFYSVYKYGWGNRSTSNGQATLIAMGGFPGFVYQWQMRNPQETPEITEFIAKAQRERAGR
jgi:hypothetical protein